MKLLPIILLSLFASQVPAAVQQTSSDTGANNNFVMAPESFDRAQIKRQFALLGMNIVSIDGSPIAGLAQVMTDKGLFYMSDDGVHLLQGRMFNVPEGMVNETEKALSAVRVEGIKQFDDGVIEYAAKDPKHVITVYTDITCGYCRKMHREMKSYNDAGITVRYLAFPRNGLSHPSFKDMQSVWCAEDPQQAMDAAKNAGEVTDKSCGNTVKEQFMFGQQVGITGTPAVILADGSLISGYLPVDRLLPILNQK